MGGVNGQEVSAFSALCDQGQEAREERESASRTQLPVVRKRPPASCPEKGHHR